MAFIIYFVSSTLLSTLRYFAELNAFEAMFHRKLLFQIVAMPPKKKSAVASNKSSVKSSKLTSKTEYGENGEGSNEINKRKTA